MGMRVDIVTLFPEMCQQVLDASIIGRAAKRGYIETHCHQIRDYTLNKQKQTDDYPYGGGCGHYDAYKYDYDFAAFAVIFILLHLFGRFLLYNVVRDIITHNAEYINFCELNLRCGNYCHVSCLGVYYNMNFYCNIGAVC